MFGSTLVTVLLRYMFFFSSRRRHTRLTCDWSSDVCSSDLLLARAQALQPLELQHQRGQRRAQLVRGDGQELLADGHGRARLLVQARVVQSEGDRKSVV